MSMSKKDFIALADAIREHNRIEGLQVGFGNPKTCSFTPKQLSVLASFCASSNPAFMRERWLGYIAGTNGKNGGARV